MDVGNLEICCSIMLSTKCLPRHLLFLLLTLSVLHGIVYMCMTFCKCRVLLYNTHK